MARTPAWIVLACLLVLALPRAEAGAQDATCSYSADTRVVRVSVRVSGQLLARDDEGRITLAGAQCGAATVHNTDLIELGSTAEYGSIDLGLANGGFAPGFTDEPGGSDEIELDFDPEGTGRLYGVVVRGSDAAERVTVGSDDHLRHRVNLNAAEADGVDADVEDVGSVTIEGGGGADRLSVLGGDGTGGSGWSPVLRGQDGDDTLLGADGGDVLDGGPGDDALASGPQRDHLVGGPGNDSLNAGEADDRLVPGPGSDTIDAGGETDGPTRDLVDYGDATGPLVVDLATGLAVADGHGGVDVVTDVESVHGGRFGDHLAGDDGPNVLSGFEGDDTIDARGGNDALAREWRVPGDGDDVIDMGAGDDSADGGEGDDRLAGGPGDDFLKGSTGDDDFDGGPDTDFADLDDPRGVDARLANDVATFRDGSGAEALVGVEGLRGGWGDDLLVGDGGANVLSGEGGGEDVLRGAGGADSLKGDDDWEAWDIVDVFDYSAAPSGIALNATTVTSDGHGSADVLSGDGRLLGSQHADSVDLRPNYTLIQDIEGLGGNDTILGGSSSKRTGFAPARISGGSGNDTIDGGEGPDWISGGPGVDSLRGGEGDSERGGDRLMPEAPLVSGIVVDLGAGVVANDGQGGADTVAEFEIVEGTERDDLLTGGGEPEVFEDRGGNDRVDGGGGDDAFSMGAGDDAYLGGGGGADQLVFAHDHPSGARVDLLAQRVHDDGRGGTDEVGGVEDVIGTPHRDELVGDGAANRLRGRGGDDLIEGRGGDDRLEGSVPGGGMPDLRGGPGDDDVYAGYEGRVSGGPGDDRLRGGTTRVQATYARAPGGIVADLAAGTVEDGEGGTDRLATIGGIDGSPYADRVTGGGAGDRIDGAGGADTLSGGGGDDRLTGGPGRDDVAGDGGTDTLLVADAEPDAARCGEGEDRAEADHESVDTVDVDCESVERGPSPQPGAGDAAGDGSSGGPEGGSDAVGAGPGPGTGPGDPGSGTGGPPGGTAPRDTMAPRVTLTRSGSTLRVALSEPAALTFTVRRVVKRRCGGRVCVSYGHAVITRVALGPRSVSQTLRKLLRGARRGRGLYRVTVDAVDAAGNRARPKPAHLRGTR